MSFIFSNSTSFSTFPLFGPLSNGRSKVLSANVSSSRVIPSLARKARRGLSQRLNNAEQAILALTPPRGRGKRQQKDLDALESSVGSILKKYRVEGLVEVSYIREEEQRSIRKYKDNPARTEKSIRYVVQVQRNQQAISEVRRAMGWRLYVTSGLFDK